MTTVSADAPQVGAARQQSATDRASVFAGGGAASAVQVALDRQGQAARLRYSAAIIKAAHLAANAAVPPELTAELAKLIQELGFSSLHVSTDVAIVRRWLQVKSEVVELAAAVDALPATESIVTEIDKIEAARLAFAETNRREMGEARHKLEQNLATRGSLKSTIAQRDALRFAAAERVEVGE